MASEAFNPAGWAGYVPMTSDHTKITEAVGNLLIDLSLAPASFWSAVASDGRDIRVTNDAGTTAYSFEFVNFSVANETGILFFDSSSVISTAVNRTWRVYAGNAGATMPAATATLGRNAVWSGYSMVLHLDEDPAASGPQFIDATGNGNDGTAIGGMLAGDSVDARVGRGVSFDGLDDYIEIAHSPGIRAQRPMTMEAWIQKPIGGSASMFNTRELNAGWRFVLSGDGTFFLTYYGVVDLSMSGGPVDDQWHHVAFALAAGGAGTFYLDGQPIGTGTINSAAPGATAPLRIAVGSITNTSSSVPSAFRRQAQGESRIATLHRSAGYFATHYANQSSPATFWSTGAWVPSASAFRPAWHVQQRRLNRMAC